MLLYLVTFFVDVHDLHTFVDIWTRLQSRFMHASMARSMELKGRLTRIKKTASQTMDGYFKSGMLSGNFYVQ